MKKTPAERRAAMRAQPEEDPEFQIAPMIDILLVLLVFFMSISTTEVLQTNHHLVLPVAKDAKPKDRTVANGQTIVNVLWNPAPQNVGTISIDDVSYPLATDIIPLLQKKLSVNPNMRILMRADKSVKYEYMKTILRAIGTAGAQNVTFSVVDKDPGAHGASPAPAPAT